jgi:adenine-specific DNA-methyltransferase
MTNRQEDKVDRLDLITRDLVDENITKISSLFPHCVTEGADGKIIDFDLLKQELSRHVIEGNKERYRLEWPGKKEAIVTANLPTTKTLRPVREDSVDFDTTENIYIEGDNLEVLKLLQESYLGKIKMIYIDPPYNTGKDFVYKDNFSKDANDELLESGQKDEYNQRLVVNPETAGRYHSDWLTMMYPRLKLARNLLTDDGVIFISIDDNEVHNLRKMCDELFGEINFIASIIWEKIHSTKNDAKHISDNTEFILLYCKSTEIVNIELLPRSEKMNNRYQNPDNDPRGPWSSGDLVANETRTDGNYIVTGPTGKEFTVPGDKHWVYKKDNLLKMIEEGRIWFGKNGDAFPRKKRYLSEVQQGKKADTLWKCQCVGHNQEAKQEVKKLFNEKNYFQTPKPVRLIIEQLLICTKENDIILDFFSGSATTAHAVIQQNAIDNKKRKFILVQLPELIEKESETINDGFHNICDLGKERIRRAANKIKEEKIQKAKNDGLFADFKDTQDFGFRVFRLSDSNMQDVYYKPNDYTQNKLDLFADNVKPDRTAEDLLVQVMLDWGLALSLKIETKTISSKTVYFVAENSLVACFEKDIDESFAKEIAKEKPLRIVFKDSSFKDDTAKSNVRQLLKQLSPNTEMKVI